MEWDRTINMHYSYRSNLIWSGTLGDEWTYTRQNDANRLYTIQTVTGEYFKQMECLCIASSIYHKIPFLFTVNFIVSKTVNKFHHKFHWSIQHAYISLGTSIEFCNKIVKWS